MQKEAVKLPTNLVKEAQAVGLSVPRSCELGLEERIEAVRNGTSIQKINHSNDGERPLATVNKSPKEIFDEFKDFCEVDLDLADATIKGHLVVVRDFLKYFNGNISEITKQEIREYLRIRKKEEAKGTYANRIMSLRRFLRDYLNAGRLIEGFKPPRKKSKNNLRIPDKDDLREFLKYIDQEKYRTAFMFLASTGLRTSEVTNLRMSDVDFDRRMVTPNHDSETKRAYISFYNPETEEFLYEFLPQRKENDDRLFQITSRPLQKAFCRASEKSGIKIMPKSLRRWFAKEMRNQGVSGEHIDAFAGRVPKSVRAKHYTDYSPERLKEIYDKADINVLEEG